MHDLRLIHTDLKPENILFISPEYVKVPDYKVFMLSWCSIFRLRFLVSSKMCGSGAMILLYHILLKLCQIITNFLNCRSHSGCQKREPLIRDCQSQVLLRLLILVVRPMSTKITTILSLLGIIGHLRLFLASFYVSYFIGIIMV